jgi:hypothetical protein
MQPIYWLKKKKHAIDFNSAVSDQSAKHQGHMHHRVLIPLHQYTCNTLQGAQICAPAFEFIHGNATTPWMQHFLDLALSLPLSSTAYQNRTCWLLEVFSIVVSMLTTT